MLWQGKLSFSLSSREFFAQVGLIGSLYHDGVQ